MFFVLKVIFVLNVKVKGIEFIFNYRGLLDLVVGMGICVLNIRCILVVMSLFELFVKVFLYKMRIDFYKKLI